MEEILADAVDIGRRIVIDRLAMHGLPKRTRLDASLVEHNTHGLNITVRFTVRMHRASAMNLSGSATNGTTDRLSVGQLFTFDF